MNKQVTGKKLKKKRKGKLLIQKQEKKCLTKNDDDLKDKIINV